MTRIGGENMVFETLPQDTLSLEVPPSLVTILSKGPAYVITSSYEDLYKEQIALLQYSLVERGSKNNLFVGGGFTDFERPGGVPTMTCANATASIPILFIQAGNETMFDVEGSCYTFSVTSQYDLTLLRDRILYEMLGIPVVEQ